METYRYITSVVELRQWGLTRIEEETQKAALYREIGVVRATSVNHALTRASILIGTSYGATLETPHRIKILSKEFASDPAQDGDTLYSRETDHYQTAFGEYCRFAFGDPSRRSWHYSATLISPASDLTLIRIDDHIQESNVDTLDKAIQHAMGHYASLWGSGSHYGTGNYRVSVKGVGEQKGTERETPRFREAYEALLSKFREQ